MTTLTVTSATYALAAGETLADTDEEVLWLRPPGGVASSVTLAGEVRLTLSAAVTQPFSTWKAVQTDTVGFVGGTLTIAQGGSVIVDGAAARTNAIGVYSYDWSPKVANHGLIDVTVQRDARGIDVFAPPGPWTPDFVVNSGIIRVRSTAGDAYGVDMGAGQGFSNSGLIEVTAAGTARGLYMFQWGGAFLNTGTIRAIGLDPALPSVAVDLDVTIGRGFVNAGLLEGDYALRFIDYNAPFTPFNEVAPVFENYGQMVGRVDLGPFKQVLRNDGSIVGEVTLGGGDDAYDGRRGITVGMVGGGEGNDTLTGGAAFDYLHGNQGADRVLGGGGDDWVVGGRDDDLLFGGEGADLLLGNMGLDTLDGGVGDDVVRGGQGDDLVAGGLGDDWVSGDRGDDTLTGGNGADIFHTFDGAGVDRVTDFNVAEGDQVYLLPGTVWNVTQVGADVVVDAGDARLVLVGVQMSTLPTGWIFGS